MFEYIVNYGFWKENQNSTKSESAGHTIKNSVSATQTLITASLIEKISEGGVIRADAR